MIYPAPSLSGKTLSLANIRELGFEAQWALFNLLNVFVVFILLTKVASAVNR